MAKTELLRLPRTVQEAASLDVERLARDYILDRGHRTPNGYPEETVIIAGLLQLLDAHRSRADRHAVTIATVCGRAFADRFKRAMRGLAKGGPT